MEPYLEQLQPGARKDMIKAASKLAYVEVKRFLRKQKKGGAKPSSSSSASSTYSSSSSSPCTSDEDMFKEKKKRKKTSKVPVSPQANSSQLDTTSTKDPLQISDSNQSESD